MIETWEGRESSTLWDFDLPILSQGIECSGPSLQESLEHAAFSSPCRSSGEDISLLIAKIGAGN